jgi:hypothetical protein
METEFAGAPVDGGTYPALIFHDVVLAWEEVQAMRKAEEESEDAADEPAVDETYVPPAETVAPPVEEVPAAPVEEAPVEPPVEEEVPADPGAEPPATGDDGGVTGKRHRPERARAQRKGRDR